MGSAILVFFYLCRGQWAQACWAPPPAGASEDPYVTILGHRDVEPPALAPLEVRAGAVMSTRLRVRVPSPSVDLEVGHVSPAGWRYERVRVPEERAREFPLGASVYFRNLEEAAVDEDESSFWGGDL